MDMPSTLSSASPEAPIKFTEHSKYFTICTQLGKTCLKEYHMSLDWDDDDEEEDQDRCKDQKTSQTNPRSLAAMIITLKQPNPPSLTISARSPVKPI